MNIPRIDVVYERQWSSLNNMVAALSNMGCMGRLFGGFPKFRYVRAGIPENLVKTFPVAALWNFAARRAKLPESFLLDEPRWVGNWVARQRDLAPMVLANGTAHRFLFPKLKDTGRTLILERGSTHPINLFLKPQQARKEAGYSHTFELPPSVTDEVEKTFLADFILAGSEEIKNSYVIQGFPAERISVATYGVNTSYFVPGEGQVERSGPIRIGIIGIIGFRKGIFRALKIGEWAKRAGIPVELHFAGPVFDPECLELIHASSADCIMHGVLKGRDLLSFIQSCDAVCLPSYEEGFGIAVLEGMSAGLPAIVSSEAGCREAVNQNLNGIVLEHFTDEEFDHLLAAPLRDRAALMQMGIVARETIIRKYEASASMNRIEMALTPMLRHASV